MISTFLIVAKIFVVMITLRVRTSLSALVIGVRKKSGYNILVNKCSDLNIHIVTSQPPLSYHSSL